MANYLRYSNSGATRNRPLNEDLINRLGYLDNLGVQAEIFSGGQPGIDEGGARVGSTRHDHGHAGDMFFYKDGRRLDWANEADRPIFQDIVRQGKAAGITGWGAGDGYMQPGSMHVGMGNAGVWGKGGKGDNAAPWLREAYYGDGSAPTAYASAPPTVRENPMVLDEVIAAAGGPTQSLPRIDSAEAQRIASAGPVPTEKPTELSQGLTKVGHSLGFSGTGKEGDPTKFMGLELGGNDGLVADLAGIAKAFGGGDTAAAPMPVAQLKPSAINISNDLMASSISNDRRRRGGLGSLGGFRV